MTAIKSEYSQYSKNAGIRDLHQFSLTLTIVVLAMFFHNVVTAGENLKQGPWKGTFLTHDGTRYKTEYHVSYVDESKTASVQIKMIYLDLEPV